MNKIELHSIREWEEKENNKPTGNIRIYVGNLHIGTCIRKNKTEEQYRFNSHFTGITYKMSTTIGYNSLEEIKTEIELSFKEFAVKIIKSFQTFTPVKKSKFQECDHCDGHGTCEGGPGALLTICQKCGGKGVVPNVVKTTAQPSKRFVSSGKKDGNGKR